MESFLELGGGAEHPAGLSDLREDPAGSGSRLGPALRASDGVNPTRPRWERRYALAVCATDLVAILVVVAVGHILGLGDYAPRFGGMISPALGLVVTAAHRAVPAPDPRLGSARARPGLRGVQQADPRVHDGRRRAGPRRPRPATAGRAAVGLRAPSPGRPAVAARPLLVAEVAAPQAGPRPVHASHARRGDGRVRRGPHPADPARPADRLGRAGSLHADRNRSPRRRRHPRGSGRRRPRLRRRDRPGGWVPGRLHRADARLDRAPAAPPGLGRRGDEHGPGGRPGPHGDGGPAPARRPGRRASAPAAHPADVRRCLAGAEEHRRPGRRGAPAARRRARCCSRWPSR